MINGTPVQNLILDRLSYGLNLIDIDPVVNELCLVVNYLGVSKESKAVVALIRFAETNLKARNRGRNTR